MVRWKMARWLTSSSAPRVVEAVVVVGCVVHQLLSPSTAPNRRNNDGTHEAWRATYHLNQSVCSVFQA